MTRIFRLSLLTTATLVAPVASCARRSSSYKDVALPNGHARSLKAKHADIRACGAVNGSVTEPDFPRADACMRAHGWAIESAGGSQQNRRQFR